MSSCFDRYLELWELTPEGEPFQTATSALQFVCKGGQHCVLKVGRTITDEATAAALLHYNGRGAIKLVAHEGLATLMQRAMPGTPLSHLVRNDADDEATRIVCKTMSALHTDIPISLNFPRIEDWAAGFERPAASKIPRALVAQASAVYADLCRTQSLRIAHDRHLVAVGQQCRPDDELRAQCLRLPDLVQFVRKRTGTRPDPRSSAPGFCRRCR